GPRKWAMRMLSSVLSRLSRTRLSDTTSGHRACNRRLIEFFAHWYPAEYLGDTIEVLVRVARSGYKIAQVPVAIRPRMAGTPRTSRLRSTTSLARAGIVLLLALVRT